MVASAPWTVAQFASKGVDVLLDTAVANPNLRLTFLWRGVLFAEMMQKVTAMNLADRVTVINEQVDVNQMLATVHGTINLAAHSEIIKAYPHSLLDSLAAGKPVLVDKPLAGTLPDADEIFSLAKRAGVPIFSSSSLRFTPSAQEIRGGAIGQVMGCDAYSACSLEKTHPDLFWYGIHGVELLFTVMRPGSPGPAPTR